MMMLIENDLKHCLYAATTAAMRAGSRIMKYYGKELDVGRKGYGYEKSDLVTAADREAQLIIEKILIDFHPDIGFLAEENSHDTNSSRFEKPYFWSVDPLDGTKAFVSHLNGFAVSIGLLKQDGTPILGVVYFPVFGDLYYGIKNQSAFHNEKELTMNNDKSHVKIYLSEAESLSVEKNRVYHSICDAILEQTTYKKIKAETIIAPVHKGALLVDSAEPAIYYGIPRKKLGVSVWDFAGIAPIVQAAGGFVSDIFGNPLDLNRKDSTFVHHHGFLFSTSKELHDLVINTFQPYAKDF
jgi:3'-phosphoadenosine 5'-phosphosulfate (PAPS) 3'-phosphatase